MRLTTVILIASLMQVSAATFGQRITMNQSMVPLKVVLKEIRKQSGYDVFYDNKVISQEQNVSVKVNDATVDETLKAALSGLNLTYRIEDKVISISKKVEPSLLNNVIARFQTIDIKGKVVDSLGNGLPGATIIIKNGKGSTTTLANGDFFLKKVDEGATLIVSYLGYVTKEVKVNSEFNYILMHESTSILDVVQVEAYRTTSRRLSTGNITSISAEQINNQPVNNPLYALQGRIPGLLVTPSSGLPGASVSLQLRGQNSLNYGGTTRATEPLVVIDGLPYQNELGAATGGPINLASGMSQMSALNFINPNDIESISVLKDADATSIYGSRGANGVILITTKKGKAGTTSVDLNLQQGYSRIPSKLNLLTTSDYIKVRKEALKNDGLLDNLENSSNSVLYPDLMIWSQNKNTDWQDDLLGKPANYTDLLGSITGGNPNLFYSFGANYHRESYVFKDESSDQKGSVRFSINSISTNQKLKIRLSAGHLFNRNTPPAIDYTSTAINLSPNAPNLYNSDGSLNWELNPSNGTIGFYNPMAAANIRSLSRVHNLYTTSDVSFEILPGLNLKSSFGFQELQRNVVRLEPSSSTNPQAILGNSPFIRSQKTTSNVLRNSNLEPQLNYFTNLFGGNLTSLVGFVTQSQNGETSALSAYGFANDALINNLSAATIYTSVSNGTTQYKSQGTYARVSYNYGDKYLLNLSGRRDGSSRFGPKSQFGFFGSVGAAWIFSREKFFKPHSIISFGKLRGSYGSSGNDGVADYAYLSLYQTAEETYQGAKPILSLGLSNPYFEWELTKKIELAIDLGFFNDRILLSANYFRNRSSNQLGPYPVPLTSGFGDLIKNQPALIQNMGSEVTLNTSNIQSKIFSWSTNFNFTVNRNKLIADLDGDRTRIGLGQPFYGYTEVAIFKGVNQETGEYQFLDKSGNVTSDLNAEFETKRIMTIPKFYGGLSNTFTTKGFALDVFFQFVKQTGRNIIYQYSYPGLGANNLPVEALDRWKSTEENGLLQKYSTIPFNSNLYNLYEKAKQSDIAYVDASFIRLKNLAISYAFPDKLKRKVSAKGLKAYLHAQNLLTFTRFKGGDPEVQDPYVLPPLKSITAGIQLIL